MTASGRLPLDRVLVLDRYRKDLGDIDSLVRSIREIGLIQPIVVTSANELVAGQRRLEAVRRLGWATIPVYRVASVQDAASRLKAERDDNTCRKDMLPSEKAALGAALDQVEVRAAKERQAATQINNNSVRDEHGRIVTNLPHSRRTGERPLSLTRDPERRSADVVGEALGISGRTYSDLRLMHGLAHGQDSSAEERALGERALRAIDHGAGVKAVADEIRPQARALRTGSPDGYTKPKLRAKREEQKELFQELADRGYSSPQMAKELGFGVEYIRRRAKDFQIEIPADKVLHKNSQRIDSTHVVQQAATSLEGTVSALDLVDLSTVDVTEDVVEWMESIGRSLRQITKFNRQLKEKVNGA